VSTYTELVALENAIRLCESVLGAEVILPIEADEQEARPLPRRALYRGRQVRVLGYEGDNVFRVLDHTDATHRVHRTRMTFVKGS
jgi:hypothetical protein